MDVVQGSNTAAVLQVPDTTRMSRPGPLVPTARERDRVHCTNLHLENIMKQREATISRWEMTDGFGPLQVLFTLLPVLKPFSFYLSSFILFLCSRVT